MTDFKEFFATLSGHGHAHDWQQELAAEETCGNRLIRIPTGFGKTLGAMPESGVAEIRSSRGGGVRPVIHLHVPIFRINSFISRRWV